MVSFRRLKFWGLIILTRWRFSRSQLVSFVSRSFRRLGDIRIPEHQIAEFSFPSSHCLNGLLFSNIHPPVSGARLKNARSCLSWKLRGSRSSKNCWKILWSKICQMVCLSPFEAIFHTTIVSINKTMRNPSHFLDPRIDKCEIWIIRPGIFVQPRVITI